MATSAAVSMVKVCLTLCVMMACWSPSLGALHDHEHSFCANPPLSSDEAKKLMELVPTEEGHRIELQCRYCSFLDNVTVPAAEPGPRVWYRREVQEGGAWQEVQLGMEAPLTSNRVYKTPEHTLVIQNFQTDTDSGRYECRGPTQRIAFLVDGLQPSNASLVSGNRDAFLEFTTKFMSPLEEGVIEQIRATPVTQWGPWGLCKECQTGKARRLRRGRCSLQASDSSLPFDLKAVSCRSTLLARDVVTEELRAALLAVPDFELAEPCHCPWPIATTAVESEVTHPGALKFFLREADYMEIMCPIKSHLDSPVTWSRNGKPLITRQVEQLDPNCSFWCSCSRLLVTRKGSLLVYHAQPNVEGNYACHSDNHDWAFKIKVYDVSDICSFSTNGIMVVVFLCFLPFLLCCCCFTCGLSYGSPCILACFGYQNRTTASWPEGSTWGPPISGPPPPSNIPMQNASNGFSQNPVQVNVPEPCPQGALGSPKQLPIRGPPPPSTMPTSHSNIPMQNASTGFSPIPVQVNVPEPNPQQALGYSMQPPALI